MNERQASFPLSGGNSISLAMASVQIDPGVVVEEGLLCRQMWVVETFNDVKIVFNHTTSTYVMFLSVCAVSAELLCE